jgi:hypothetical protein
MIIEEPLLEWATPRQAEYIRAVHAAGSIRKAAKTLGLHHSAITKSLHRLQKLAALHGYSPACDMTRKVPDPFIVKGVSSYYNKDGELAGQWVKSKLDNDKLNAMLVAAAAAMSEDIPKAEPVKAPKSTIAALLNLYVITDAHVGMLAWDKESGEDWDLKIAEYTLVKCFERMIETAPAAESCVISELGDFLHFDSLKPVTPEHGRWWVSRSGYSAAWFEPPSAGTRPCISSSARVTTTKPRRYGCVTCLLPSTKTSRESLSITVKLHIMCISTAPRCWRSTTGTFSRTRTCP